MSAAARREDNSLMNIYAGDKEGTAAAEARESLQLRGERGIL